MLTDDERARGPRSPPSSSAPTTSAAQIEREVLGAAERAARRAAAGARRRARPGARRRGLAPRRGRDRRLADRRAPPAPGGPDRARRRRHRPGLGPQRPRLRPARGAAGLRRAPDPLRRPPRRRRSRDRGRTGSRPSARRSRRTAPSTSRAIPTPGRGRRRGRRRREPRPRGRRAAAAAGAVRERQPRGAAARSGRPARRRAADGRGRPPRAVRDLQRRPAGRSGSPSASTARSTRRRPPGPLDLSVELELNEWNGAVEPRVVLGDALPGRPTATAADGAQERRSASTSSGAATTLELEAQLEPWPPRRRPPAAARASTSTAAAPRASRRSPRSPPAARRCWRCARMRSAAASWSSAAARPARFGGGELAIVSARLGDEAVAAAEARVSAAGCGVVLADWAALARDPGARRALRPPGARRPAAVRSPRPALRRAGEGYLHRLSGKPEAEFALRVHADEWPSRSSLADALPGARCGRPRRPRRATAARALLCGDGRAHPLSPEIGGALGAGARRAGLDRMGAAPALIALLGVVSSTGTDLERSAAFVAYRDRYEEGRRYLSEGRQS